MKINNNNKINKEQEESIIVHKEVVLGAKTKALAIKEIPIIRVNLREEISQKYQFSNLRIRSQLFQL